MRIDRRFIFIAIVALWWLKSGTLSAHSAPYPDDCNNVCSESGSCTDTCYATELDFINDNRISCYTWGVYGSPCCGDGVCSEGEDSSSCLSDCPSACGNGVCGEGEDPWNCFADCHCGDGICNAGENASSCANDCYLNPTEYDCTAEAAACTAKCGETVTWSVRNSWTEYVLIWIPTGPWGQGFFIQVGIPRHDYDYSYGSGVESFECDEVSGTSYCACRY